MPENERAPHRRIPPRRPLSPAGPLTCALLATGLAAPPATAGPAAASRWRIAYEGGVVSSGYNDLRIPADGGTFFSLDDDLSTGAAAYSRLELGYRLGERSRLRLLLAPLSLDAEGDVGRDVRFAGALFPAGTPLEATYRFDSYRLSWIRDWPGRAWQASLGVTAKLRDAAITVRDPGGASGREAEDSNTGFVPLLHFRLQRRLGPALDLLLEGDALAAPQGRAEDVLLALLWRARNRLDLYAGYRLLEGGADVDAVYTFALLHYAALGARLRL